MPRLHPPIRTLQLASSPGSGPVSPQELDAGLSLLHLLQQSSDPAPNSNPNADGVVNSALLLAATKLTPSSPSASDACLIVRRNARAAALANDLTLAQLRPHFDKPIVQVAKELGICMTFLKKICRRCGLQRWPHRRIRSLTRTLHSLRRAHANATSREGQQQLARRIQQVERTKAAVLLDPDAGAKLGRHLRSAGASSDGPDDELDLELGDDLAVSLEVEVDPTEAQIKEEMMSMPMLMTPTCKPSNLSVLIDADTAPLESLLSLASICSPPSSGRQTLHLEPSLSPSHLKSQPQTSM